MAQEKDSLWPWVDVELNLPDDDCNTPARGRARKIDHIMCEIEICKVRFQMTRNLAHEIFRKVEKE